MGVVFQDWFLGWRSDMSCHKSIHILAFTVSPRKLTILLGYFICTVLFLSLINSASGGSLRRTSNAVEGGLSPRLKRSLYYPNMVYSDTEFYQPRKRLYQEKRDPLFENMSTEELYRMLQLIDMAGGNGPIIANTNELNNLNSLLRNANRHHPE